MLYLSRAIKKIRPTAEFVIIDNDYSTIVWHQLDGEAPTQAEINAAIIELQADEEAQAETQAAARAALLDRLGITADEAKLLLS